MAIKRNIDKAIAILLLILITYSIAINCSKYDRYITITSNDMNINSFYTSQNALFKSFNEIPTVKETEVQTTTQQETTTTGNLQNYTEDELNILYRCIEAEATGEGLMGKILVCNVIMNRINDPRFPDTIKDVIFQKKPCTQFTCTVDGRYYSVEITEETKDAVYRAIELGEDYSQGALYFQSVDIDAPLNYTELFQYGNHVFYTN